MKKFSRFGFLLLALAAVAALITTVGVGANSARRLARGFRPPAGHEVIRRLGGSTRRSCPIRLATNAGPIFAQMLVKTNNKIDGAIAANDNIAGAIIADLKARHLKPIPLSGQDATPQGIQYILAGWQTGTVYKYVPDEANAAAAAAVALIKGQTPKSNGTRKNGSKNEPTLALPVVWITKANYTRLFTDKFLKKSDICIGVYKQYCK